MADGFFRNDEEHQRKLIDYIRKYQPDIVIANALTDRHPDHGKGGRLIADACFLAGLRKIETEWEGVRTGMAPQEGIPYDTGPHADPTFIVDISVFLSKRWRRYAAIKASFTTRIQRAGYIYSHRRLFEEYQV